MLIKTLRLGDYGTNCHILAKEGAPLGLVIDPGAESAEIFRALEEAAIQPAAVLITHGHYDHVSAAPDVAQKFGIPVFMHPDDQEGYHSQQEIIESWGGRMMDDFEGLEEKLYTLAGMEFRVIHTPGHSPGSVCFDFNGILFSGDTLFYGTIGRTDIPGGDPRLLQASLRHLAAEFPEGDVYPGHGPKTTMAGEFKRNFFLQKASGRSPIQ